MLHGAALSCVLMPSKQKVVKQLQPIAINYSTRVQGKNTRKKQKALDLAPKGEPRIGSPDYLKRKRNLTDTITAINFLERLKAHIDPNWAHAIENSRAKLQPCSTTLYIDADKNGTVVYVAVVQNDCSDKLKHIAVNTVKSCNLLPPPKNLLAKSGLFELEWTFTIKR